MFKWITTMAVLALTNVSMNAQGDEDNKKSELEKQICDAVGSIHYSQTQINLENETYELVGLRDNKQLESPGIRIVDAQDKLRSAQDEYKKLYKTKYPEKKCVVEHYLEPFYKRVVAAEDIIDYFCQFKKEMAAGDKILNHYARILNAGGSMPKINLYMAGSNFVNARLAVQYFQDKYQRLTKKKLKAKDCKDE